jgi:phosphohistidine phosphatase SixA
LYARHERTQLDVTLDEEPLQFDDCSTQRNLSTGGRASAKENGTALKLLNIPIAQSFASPFCRTVETAELLFGNTEKVIALSGRQSPTETFSLEKAGQYTKEFLLKITPPSNSNIAVTGHWGTIRSAAGIHLHEGDVAVFTVDNGELKHWGTIAAATWSDVIHDGVRARSMSNHGR